MTKDVKDQQASRRAQFGAAIVAARGRAGLSQVQLAETLGSSQPTVSAWEKGIAEPTAETVFRIEQALNANPGSLSRHLGFLPTSADPAAVSVEDAVAVDRTLDDVAKKAVLAVYHAVTRSKARV